MPAFPVDPGRPMRRPAEVSVPTVRPFRALRFRPEAAPDLALVVSPPYDVIDADLQRALLARDPRNVVRLDLPEAEQGEDPDERYRRAARTLAAWRSDGTLHKDPRASVYVYEQVYRVPGSGEERAQRGFFARLRLEPLEPGSGVRPHERTLAGPREDRYRLLRATGVNTSPVVVMYEDSAGDGETALDAVTRTAPVTDVVDDDGVCHRLWIVPDDADSSGIAARLVAVAERQAVTIADGHHRYETALRYRDERRMSRSCEEDPPFDYLLALFLEATRQRLTVLPTHRLVHGADGSGRLGPAALERLFTVEPASREGLATFGAGEPGGRGRFGLWTADGGFVLTGRREALAPHLPPGGDALRGLDVSVLAVALEQLAGIDREAVAAGGRVSYTKSAGDAIAAVDAGKADAAFLLEPTPVEAILRVAEQGDVMPQKSTYFYPKPLTGLVINPLEW
jgi:uncharacterized protein (DUF1015 family)